jgi:uncharacterized SAM-binding protein YcdF (DUF218 family)
VADMASRLLFPTALRRDNEFVMDRDETIDGHDRAVSAAPPRGLRRLVGALALLVAALVLAFLIGFGSFAGHVARMTTPTDPAPADAIIVLTGGSARIDAGVELLSAGKGGRLLISGVNPMAGLDDLRRATGADAELFACCVDIDHAALDTIGNAAESAKWLNSNSFDSAIVVTNNYHMPRSLMEMRRAIDGLDLQPYPVVNTNLDRGGWITKPQAVRVLFTEYTKFLASLARGAVAPAMRAVIETEQASVDSR